MSFHFGWGEAVEEDVNLSFMGFVSSPSVKRFVEEGERTGGRGDLGSCIVLKGLSVGACCGPWWC